MSHLVSCHKNIVMANKSIPNHKILLVLKVEFFFHFKIVCYGHDLWELKKKHLSMFVFFKFFFLVINKLDEVCNKWAKKRHTQENIDLMMKSRWIRDAIFCIGPFSIVNFQCSMPDDTWRAVRSRLPMM